MLGHPAHAEHMIIRGIAPQSLEEDHRHALDLNRAISEPMDMGDDILRIEIDGEAEVINLRPMPTYRLAAPISDRAWAAYISQ